MSASATVARVPQSGLEQKAALPAPAQSQSPDISATDQIATLAYALWQQRGCPIGSPEQDWLEAEQQLIAANAQRSR